MQARLTAPETRLLDTGRAALRREGAAVTALSDQLDGTFVRAVTMILECRGHVAVSGAGTSAAVARRRAHLLTCVWVPAFYLSAGDSAHGAASVTPRDVLLVVSKGGEIDELNHLVRVARRTGAPVIAVTAEERSTLARQSDVVVRFAVPAGADGHGVIAMGSSLASAAIGDALCWAVLGERGYDPERFREVYPGGAADKRLAPAR